MKVFFYYGKWHLVNVCFYLLWLKNQGYSNKLKLKHGYCSK